MRGPNGEHGGEVIRSFNMKGERLPIGAIIEAQEALSLPIMNRRALVAGGFVRWFEKAQLTERIRVNAGGGKFHVYDAVRVTTEPVDKATADAMLGHSSEEAA